MVSGGRSVDITSTCENYIDAYYDERINPLTSQEGILRDCCSTEEAEPLQPAVLLALNQEYKWDQQRQTKPPIHQGNIA